MLNSLNIPNDGKPYIKAAFKNRCGKRYIRRKRTIEFGILR